MASELQTLRDIRAAGNLNPVQNSRLRQLEEAGGIGSEQGITGAPGSDVGDLTYEGQIKRALKLQQEAVQPAVQSYQASIPEIQKNYQQQRTQLQAEEAPLKQRYTQLIDEIKGNQKTAENRQTRTTNAELARRGISGGNLYDQTLTDAVNPVTQQYTGLLNDTSLKQDQSIRELVNTIANSYTTQTAEERSVQNAIAQLLSGAASQGIQSGQNQFNTDASMKFQKEQASRDESARQAAQSLAERQFNQVTLPGFQQVTLPESQASLQNLLSQIAKRGQSGSVSKINEIYNNSYTNAAGNASQAPKGFVPLDRQPIGQRPDGSYIY